MNQKELSNRRLALCAGLSPRKLDALLVSSAANIRYLSGFTGSNALLLVLPNRAVLFTDPRYQIQASKESDCRVRVVRGPLLLAAATASVRRLGFERAQVSYDAYLALKKNLPRGASLVPVAGLVEALRMTKSAGEIALMRRAADTASRAFAQSMKRVRPGVRESALAAEIDHRMRRLGAEKPAFETIVASGERTALPHARPTDNILSRNQLLLVDMGACQDGYTSDMTRMAFLGRPAARVRALYNAVLEAQLAALAAVREGVTAEEIDRQARRVLRAEKLDCAFVHSAGHGLGLEVHEPPRLGKGDRTRLQKGMAITIEPGVYLQGFGGIRIEDTVVVTTHGCEVLTPTSKELIVP